MLFTKVSYSILILLLVSACSDREANQTELSNEVSINSNETPDASEKLKSKTNHDVFYKKVLYGKANLADIRQALTDKDIGRLTNTIHALYNYRWHRGVTNILDDMWVLERKNTPELSWELFEKTPIKLALASTINRIKIFNTDEYKNYLHEHKYDKHEFHRAQVIIALAFNGDPKDVGYLKEMADGNNHYVTQSAVTALAILGGEKAKQALGSLWKKHKGTPRGDLIEEVLMDSYKQSPTLETPSNETENSS